MNPDQSEASKIFVGGGGARDPPAPHGSPIVLS